MKTQIIRKKCWDCQTSEVEKELYMCDYEMKEGTDVFDPENTVCIDCFLIRREKMLNKRRQEWKKRKFRETCMKEFEKFEIS